MSSKHTGQNTTRHGGARAGAGRPKGQGRYGEPTRAVRIPESMVEHVLESLRSKGHRLPFYISRIPAGGPSEPTGDVEDYLSLRDLIGVPPADSFIVQVQGDSMIDAGIFEGDLLVVDPSATARHGDIVVASLRGEATVKRLYSRTNTIQLLPENERYPPIPVHPGDDFRVIGVVTASVRRFRR